MKEFKKNEQGLFVCEECGKLCKGTKGLGQHIHNNHESVKTYYDEWLKEPFDGVCENCKNITSFVSIIGYRNTCSVSCAAQISASNCDYKTKKQRKEKGIQTCLKKYNVEWPQQLSIIKENKKLTCLKKYGVEHVLQLKSIMDKKKLTCLEKYGVEHPFQLQEIHDKSYATNLFRYGDIHPSRTNFIKEKQKEIFKRKYGVENPMQVKEIFDKNQRSCFCIKKFRNTDIWYQASYELDFLEKYYDKCVDIQRGPSIKYIYKGKNKVYHPDFYISSLNLIIEIKSLYLSKIDKQKINAKKKATIASGFDYIMIVNKNYHAFDKILSE